MPPPAARRPLDEAALQHVLRRLAAAPWLHGEAARRMAERLPIVKLQPATVLDWWPSLGGGAALLTAAYPKARRIDVERVAAPVVPWWRRRRGPTVVTADALEAGATELVWANMALHYAAEPPAVLAQWQRSLAVGGFLMFSTLGPGTFEALTRIYRAHGWGAPFAPFVDMHDVGDMLIEAGFADPVMDQQTLTLTWADAPALLAELRSLGGNAATDRTPGLRTPRWRRRLEAALAALAGADGRPALQVELVFGHAFKPVPRAAVAPTTAVPLDDLRAQLRARRGNTPLR